MSQENLPLLLLATLLPATLVRSVEINGAVGGAAAYMQRVSGRGYPAADIVSTQLPVPSYAAQLPVPSYAAQLPVPSYAAQLPVPSYAAQLPVPSYAAVINGSDDGRKPDPIANPQRSVIQEPTRETWSELMTKVSQLIKIGLDPYVSFFEEYPLHLSDTLDTVRSAITNSRIAENPALAAAMGTAAVALPLIFQISRSLLENTVSLLDNSMFVATGHGLGRRSLDEDIYDEIADILLRIVNLVTRHLGK